MLINYIDPGTGSMLISATVALFSVLFFMAKGFIYRKFNFNGSKGESIDPAHKYGLVFYSEGAQYWNVFKELVEACSEEGVALTYLTSDKEDPGLKIDLNGVSSIYIGTGREAYFSLNRLNADMLVLTTPGLDVLEIKRSKNVKHYCHLSHATSSIAGYKAFSLDYYDSVIMGGEGDIDIIRHLEELRNTKKKDIEIIGHTYLDVLRKRISSLSSENNYFNNDKQTILISPTWGNHGLLNNYGEEILQQFEDSNEYNLIVRPHPQSFISDKELMDTLMTKFPNTENRKWDLERENIIALSQTDLMISDFSGIIFDFFTLFKKPIITIHAQYEKRGREAADLLDDPWDLKILDKIGTTIEKDNVKNIVQIAATTIETFNPNGFDLGQTIDLIDKCPGQAKINGIRFLKDTLHSLESEEISNYQTDKNKNYHIIENGLIEVTSTNTGFLNKYLKPLMTTNFAFQAFLSSVLLLSYVYMGRKLLPEPGLNQEFLFTIFKPLTLISATLGIIFFLSVWISNKGEFTFSKSKEKLNFKNILLTALPMTAVIQYILANQDILTFSSSITVFIQLWGIAILSIVIIPWLLSPVVTSNLSIPVSLSYTFIIFNMAGFGRTTEMNYIIILLVGIILLSFIGLFLKKQTILIFVSLAMFLSTGVTGVIGLSNKTIDGDNDNDFNNGPTIQLTQGKKAVKKSDIYILIYDSYANEETLNAYGYDNSEQMEYLLDQDFALYDGVYSVGDSSLTSTSNVLNPDPFNGTTENYRKVLSGQGSTLTALRSLGYNLQSVFPNDYYTKGNTSTFDFSYPSNSFSIDPSVIIRNAILEGEFRFDADFSTLTYDDYLEAKHHILNSKPHDLNFYYSHDELPGHSQNSGVLRPDESEIHFANLDKVNLEMRDNISAIQAHNKDAIIVVMGDHGPYLTKNGIGLSSYDLSDIYRLDIQDRYGSFLAIKWPEKDYAATHDIQIIQDVMPAILSYIYDDSSFFDQMRMPREILKPEVIGGAMVTDGIIHGGKNHGEPLFTDRNLRLVK